MLFHLHYNWLGNYVLQYIRLHTQASVIHEATTVIKPVVAPAHHFFHSLVPQPERQW